MKANRPLRWRRLLATRRTTVRRMLIAGAVVGVLAGVLAQPVTGGVHPDIDKLARFALLLPALLYIAWWLLMPGYRADADEVPVPETVRGVDVRARVERIESTFDEAAVPRAGRSRIEPASEAEQRAFRASIRRDPAAAQVDISQFGLRRRNVAGMNEDADEQGVTAPQPQQRRRAGG